MIARPGRSRRARGRPSFHWPLVAALLVWGLARAVLAEPAPGSEADEIEELRAIGYVAGSEAASAAAGVVRHEPARVAPGLNLVTSGHAPVAMLMDLEGRVLHEWRAEFQQVFPDHPALHGASQPRRNFWRSAQLLPDGRLVVIWELFGLFELDRDSHVRWALPVPAHHEVQLAGNGGIVHLQAELRSLREVRDRRVIDDLVVTRDAEGRELSRLSISDALRSVHWLRLRKAFRQRARERGYGLDEGRVQDPFHTNSLWLLSPAEAGRLGAPFRAGDALLSLAMLDTIAILDLDRGAVRWSQQGPFGMQHAARMDREGRIVLFDNFLAPDRSRVLALDPRTRRVVREYTGPEEQPLHSRRSGRVQVLPNGNLLVVETDGGRALEVSGDGEIVWEFHSPWRVPGHPDRVAGLYSLERVTGDRVAWLDSGA